MFLRLFLIVLLLPFQSCSNTLIGEKLENSFDTNENIKISEKTNNKPQKTNDVLMKNPVFKDDNLENKRIIGKISKADPISKKDRLVQKPRKLTKEILFNPQPYRIILRLSGANPSAPAETVTEALRKAGVQFEVEKIERFDDGDLPKDRFLQR